MQKGGLKSFRSGPVRHQCRTAISDPDGVAQPTATLSLAKRASPTNEPQMALKETPARDRNPFSLNSNDF
jgi:hypothetical protein